MSHKGSHTTADYIDWYKLESLYMYLYKNDQYKLSLFVCIAMYTGLRVGDILSLKWSDIQKRDIEIYERKTKKYRKIRINENLQAHISKTYLELSNSNLRSLRIQGDTEFAFTNKYRNSTISRQYINQRLKHYAKKLRIKDVNISTHSLRKSFGRRVWENNNHDDRSLIILSEMFNHSNIAITRRYLGIRQSEIFDVYESLD